MCKHGTETLLEVTIPADCSHTGEAYQRTVGIDSCIADLVRALNAGGVTTRTCCCGHFVEDGSIDLADGRTLFIRRAMR